MISFLKVVGGVDSRTRFVKPSPIILISLRSIFVKEAGENMNEITINKKQGLSELNVTVGSAQEDISLPYDIRLVDTPPQTAVVKLDSTDLNNLILTAEALGVSRDRIRQALDKAVHDLGADVLDESSEHILR